MHVTYIVIVRLCSNGDTCIAEKQSNLVNLITDIEYDWDKLSVSLEVENQVLGCLYSSNDDKTAKLIAVLCSWINTFPSICTWNVVLTAVEGPIVKKHQSAAMKIH